MNPDLARIRHDLDTLSSVAGLGQPPLGREEVVTFRSLGVAGISWSTWSWLGFPLPPLAVLGLIASLFVIVVYHLTYSGGVSRTTTRDRVFRDSWWLGSVLGILIGGFFIWARFVAEMDQTTLGGSVLLFSGALLLVLAATDHWRVFFAGWGVPLFLLGMSLRLLPADALFPMLGMATALGGFAAAAIVSKQLISEQA